MTIGRIGGPMLKENLVRQGVDLSFETDLLYLDVNNMRIGVNTATPNVAMDINGVTRFKSNLQVDGSTISTYASNGNITLTPHGTGKVRVSYLTETRIPFVGPNGSIIDSPNLTFDGTTLNIENLGLGNLSISGNNIQTTNVNGNIVLDPEGTGTVIIETTDVEANRVFYSGTNKEILTNANLTFNGSNLVLTGVADISTLNVDTISSLVTNGNIRLSPNGNGNVLLENSLAHKIVYTGLGLELLTTANLKYDGTTFQSGNITLSDNTIGSADVNGNIYLDPNGTGRVVIVGNNSITIPAGDTSERPTGSIGDIRYNTDIDALEYYNGVVWSSIQTAGSAFEFSDAFNGDGSTAVFPLQYSTTSAGAFVTLNGVVQSPGVAYGVSGNTLTFTEAPAVGDRIDVRYITGADQLSLSSISNVTSNVTVAPAANVTVTVNSNVVLEISSDATTIKSQNDLRLADADSSNYVGFTAPAIVSSNVIWTLPGVDGTTGQALLTDGTGQLYWGDAGTGSGTSVTVGNTPPSSPNNGDMWWNNEEGQLKVYYTDGSSGQWVDASTGQKGDVGYTGSQGPAGGYTGSQGDIGYTGSQGDIGYTGSIGDLGYTGSQGDIGYTGSIGITGYTGSIGDLGYTGSQGDIGYTGSAGADGYTGSQGIVGYTGSIGIIGYTGSVGYTGSIGDIGYTGSVGTVPSNLTSGYTITAYDAGTQSSGTFTPVATNGNIQKAVNGGAHTLAVPNVGTGDSVNMVIQYTNNGSAGAITTSGFTKVDGAFDTTNGNIFFCYITVIGSTKYLNITAMQ